MREMCACSLLLLVGLAIGSSDMNAGQAPPAAPANLRVIAPGAPASVAATGGTPQTTTVSTAFPTALRATVRDATSTPVSSVTVTFTVPTSGPSARFGAATTATAVTDGAGVAVAPALTANGTAGSYTVTAGVSGVSGTTAFSLTNTSTPPVDSGAWVNVTPPGMSLSTSGVCGGGVTNFGAVGMAVDPSAPRAAVVGADCQGLWRTTNAGLSWTKIYTANTSVGFNGSPWSMAWAPSGNFAVSNNGYGSRGGVWRTSDDGATWTQMVSDDINDVSMSPTNENHLMAASHGGTGNWYESTNGGVTWTNLGRVPAGIWYYGEFLSDSIWIGLGPNGLWRGVKSGGVWTWSNRLSVDGPHGGAQFHRDTVNDWFYVGASSVPGLSRKVFRSRISEGGLNWTEVGSFGGGYGISTVFGTPGRIYAQAHYATTGRYDASPQQANAVPGNAWVAGPTFPQAMSNGAHSAAVVCDGTNYVLLTANTNAGVWRYVTSESCSN
jgi:hypothetical protein